MAKSSGNYATVNTLGSGFFGKPYGVAVDAVLRLFRGAESILHRLAKNSLRIPGKDEPIPASFCVLTGRGFNGNADWRGTRRAEAVE